MMDDSQSVTIKIPEAWPIKTLEELKKWQREDHIANVGTIPLLEPPPAGKPQTLICHDMAGGYLDDRFPQGSNTGEAYKFYHWQYVDSFVYFSHYFITIPPPGWINSAHKHNVRMLGTVITEWDEGLQRCKDFLASEEAYLRLAEKLTQIAQHYKFDGWLVNIENAIEEEKVPYLVDFVRQLTKLMHTAIPHSQVLWYDSVISTGKLKWQDELNDNNSLFFNVCDGIFLNYCWKDESLERTKGQVKACKRPYDAYVGVDVFGRGCRGGGGLNTNIAVQAARDHELSVAIFAQGWVYEKLENKKEFTERENMYWSLIHHLCHTHCSVTLPFSSNFCHGQGDNLFYNGEVELPGPWSNLSLQGHQPTHTNSQFMGADGSTQPNPTMSWWKEEAFIGGSCLKLSGIIPKDANHLTFSMFDAACSLPEKLYACYSYKILSDFDIDFQIGLTVKGQDGEKLVSLSGKDKKDDFIKPMTQDQVSQLLKNYTVHEGENGWKSRHYIVEMAAGCRLLGIGSTINKTHTTDTDAQILLGNLQLVDADALNECPLITDLHVSRSHVTPAGTSDKKEEEGSVEVQGVKGKRLSVELSWSFPNNMTEYYCIFCLDGSGYRLLGHTSSKVYNVVDLSLDQEITTIKFKVVPFLRSGLRPCLDNQPEVRVDV